ncbi:DeoR family transcriptional regulator [Microbacteriaceae bacterium 4G12]
MELKDFLSLSSQKINSWRSGFLKSTTSRMLTRIKAIYMYINERGTVSTQDLVDEFGITPRTIQRDLNVLQFNELVYSPSRGKWKTTRRKVRLSS